METLLSIKVLRLRKKFYLLEINLAPAEPPLRKISQIIASFELICLLDQIIQEQEQIKIEIERGEIIIHTEGLGAPRQERAVRIMEGQSPAFVMLELYFLKLVVFDSRAFFRNRYRDHLISVCEFVKVLFSFH